MALRDRFFWRHMVMARERLIADPQDPLDDLLQAMRDEDDRIRSSCRKEALRTLIVDVLFRSDRRAAHRAIIKCYTLKPSKVADAHEVGRLIQAVWGRLSVMFQGDIDELVDEMGKLVEVDEAAEGGELYS